MLAMANPPLPSCCTRVMSLMLTVLSVDKYIVHFRDIAEISRGI